MLLVLTMRDLAVTQACVQPVGNPDQGQPDQDLIYEVRSPTGREL